MKAVRQSTRQVKLSKDFRVVDEETRRAHREQRLVQLEQDNYNEQEIHGGGGDDDGYSDDDSTGPKKKKSKVSTQKSKDSKNKWLTRPVKSLERILLDNGISPENKNEVNYYTVVADPPAIRVKRPFCSVCGYFGVYTCTRCGSRFCTIRCNESHKETRCMKFSM